MARCGCGGTCNCTVQGSGAFVISGTGDQNDPYVGSINTNPASPLPISSTPSGLTVAGVQVQSSNCITLTGNGSTASPLAAAPRLDPTGLLSCGVNGLKVELPASTSYPNAGRLINVSGTYQISVKYPLVAYTTVTASAAAVNLASATTQNLSTMSATLTNPSSTEIMYVLPILQSHSFEWTMVNVNAWYLQTAGGTNMIAAFTSTGAGEYFGMGSINFYTGSVISVAAGASTTLSVTQQLRVRTTSGSGSNAASFGAARMILMGWIV